MKKGRPRAFRPQPSEGQCDPPIEFHHIRQTARSRLREAYEQSNHHPGLSDEALNRGMIVCELADTLYRVGPFYSDLLKASARACNMLPVQYLTMITHIQAWEGFLLEIIRDTTIDGETARRRFEAHIDCQMEHISQAPAVHIQKHYYARWRSMVDQLPIHPAIPETQPNRPIMDSEAPDPVTEEIGGIWCEALQMPLPIIERIGGEPMIRLRPLGCPPIDANSDLGQDHASVLHFRPSAVPEARMEQPQNPDPRFR